MKDENVAGQDVPSIDWLDCLVNEVRELWKPVNAENSTGQVISNSSYNNGIHDVLMLLYKKQSNKRI